MNKNVAIVTVILVLVVIAGYLVWLRSRFQQPVSPKPTEEIVVTPTPSPTPQATPTATPSAEEATGPARQKTATPSSTGR